VKRGEIWDAEIPAPINPRPVLILTRDRHPKARPEITVAYLTTKRRFSQAEVPLTPADDGVAKARNVLKIQEETVPATCCLPTCCLPPKEIAAPLAEPSSTK
jgi:mRNA-degrading endonuclease toxin of MazEF toxin-antitoxin module